MFLLVLAHVRVVPDKGLLMTFLLSELNQLLSHWSAQLKASWMAGLAAQLMVTGVVLLMK